ncbi:MAG: hypothetical protein QM811_15950 [Pirellulales bacterium]
MFERFSEWFSDPWVWGSLTGVSVAIMILGFVAVPRLAVRLPADHFVRPPASPSAGGPLGWTVYLARNLFALVLFLAGVLMLVLPGPGIISMIVAVAIGDFPGKRAIERAFIRNWIVDKALNAMRAKHGAPPFLIPGGKNDERREMSGGP